MSDFLISAILTHHNKQVMPCKGLLLASTDGKVWIDVTGYTLQQLKEYLNK